MIERLPSGQILRVVGNADPREFSLFLGAGASKSSGVPLAGEMIAEWRGMMFADRAKDGDEFDQWCPAQPWYGSPDEYSVLFETLFPNERARQKYVEPKIEAGFPNWGYLYLANLIRAGYFNVVFTTNFDDLVNDALTMYLAYNPVVCAADSEVVSINIATERAKIIKLHGDYLFKRLKNTVAELEELDPNMEAKFAEFSKQCGMVVIGYAGRDKSVMNAIDKTLGDDSAFPGGVWWGLRPNEEPAEPVARLATEHPKQFKLFECADFDAFMVAMHTIRKLSLPETVVKPYESVEDRFSRLIGEVDDGRFVDETIREHVRELQKELNRPWAKGGAAVSDLLEARLAVGNREYRTALTLVAEYCALNAEDAKALAIWGDALALKSEEEHDTDAGEAAVEKWRESIRIEPRHLPARYSLVRHFERLQMLREAITAGEELIELVPNDAGIRRILVRLYATAGRTGEAAELIEAMLAHEPKAADLHAMQGTICERRGLIDRALKAVEKAVELDPDNPFYRFAHANGLARMGRLEDAEREYDAAIGFDPQNLSFRLQAAQFFVWRQRPEKAIIQLERAVAIEPSSAEARGLLGELLLMQGQLSDAEPQIEAALALTPSDSRLLVNAGILQMRLGDYPKAEDVLTRAAQTNAQQPQPQQWLATLHWLQNRDTEALAALARLEQLAPMLAQQMNAMLQMLTQQTGGNPAVRRSVIENFWALNAPGQGDGAAAWNNPGADGPGQPPGGTVVDSLRSAFNRFLNG